MANMKFCQNCKRATQHKGMSIFWLIFWILIFFPIALIYALVKISKGSECAVCGCRN